MANLEEQLARARYLLVSAAVRYWEDARLNGVSDDDGTIPFRSGELWSPIIDLKLGLVVDWPEGLEAAIHYKVCDAGEYWLLDEDKNRLAKWKGHYVPDSLLCVGSSGQGDYIIFKIGSDGLIPGWQRPGFEPERWALL